MAASARPLAWAADNPCCRSARDTIAPTRNTGLKASDGLWKMAAIRPSADGPQPGTGQPGQLLAVQPDRAGDGGPGGLRQPEHGQDRHRLARAALAGQAHDLAAVHGQLGHGCDRLPAEAHPQVPDLQLDWFTWFTGTNTRRGSSTSRSPSPSRVNARAVSRMARPGNVTTHHWVVK